MSTVWDMDLPPGEKIVLLALADQANDEGRQCWPSVETIMRRSGQGERTVRRALSSLEEKGHLTRNHRINDSTQYHLHPCQNGTPAKSAPVPKPTVRGAKLAPKPPVTTIPQKASPSSGKRTTPAKPTMSLIADDFEPVMKPGSITATTVDGWPPGRLADELEHFVDHHTTKATLSADWQASWRTWVKNSKKWEPRHGNTVSGLPGRQPNLRGSRPDPALDMQRAARAAQARDSAPDHRGDHREPRLALSSLWNG